MKNRMLSLILSMIYMFSVSVCFQEISVLGAAEATQIPGIKNMLINETFESDTTNENVIFDNSGGAAGIADGAITIKRSTNSGMTIADLYMDSLKQVYRGYYVLDFTLKRSAAKDVVIRQRGTGDFCAFTWQANGRLMYYNGETKAWEYSNIITTSNTVKFTVITNTVRETYSVLMNGQSVLKDIKSRNTGMGISCLRIYLEKANYTTVTVDDICFYEAELSDEEKMLTDLEMLTKRRIVDESDYAYYSDKISKNLILYTKGDYGSDISWTSSNENLISADGTVTLASDTNNTATLTATVSSGSYSRTKSFDVTVVNSVERMSAAQADADFIDYATVAFRDGGGSEIKQSLCLPSEGVFGSAITWKSSDTSHITNSGRVIRPRNNEENVVVTMTATIKRIKTITKTLKFTVLKDDEWIDPQHMPDAEFFGVWDGDSWTTESRLDYNYSGLTSVCDAVKAGDYTLAKEELLKYYATPPREPYNITLTQRNKVWADALTDGFHHMLGAECFQGDLKIGNTEGLYETPLRIDNISIGGISSFGIRAWYNEISYAQISRHNAATEAKRPKIILTVNGEIRTYYATDSAMVRAGNYKHINYNNESSIKVQTFGDFLGNGTYHSVFNFDFSDLTDKDKITGAKLVVHGKAMPAFGGEKRMIVIKESALWNSQSVTWKDFAGTVYSFNGLADGNDWNINPDGADVEYWYQMSRLTGYSSAIPVEYFVTGDDTYIYKMLNILYDLIKDTGNQKRTSVWPVNRSVFGGLRGGWPRTLDSAIRNMYILRIIHHIAKTDVVTPEMFTMLLKGIWDTGNFLSNYHSDSGNWRQTEFNNLLLISSWIPEFSETRSGKNWLKMGRDEMEGVIFVNNMNDGSYIEDSGNYNISMFNQNVSFKEDMSNQGISVSDEYNNLLHKMAYYNGLMYTPDGRELQYGDTSSGVRNESSFMKAAEWYGDKELEYIMTFGESGTKPEWTSRHWPLSMVTAMRADWSSASPYMFTSVRGDANHGHNDDNSVIVSAYGRTLLNDAGIFTYTGTDPMRIWGRSTLAHNSVVINDTSQVGEGWGSASEAVTTGKIYDWTTNSAFDYLSQSTPLNEHDGGFEHRRSITFIKPSMWVVSDLMIPNNTAENNYKQVWHMLPDSDFTTDTQNNTIKSNYLTGANIVVANADGNNVSLNTEDGWYDVNYQQPQKAPYAYFEKNASGNVQLDTVLMVSDNDTSAQASAEKLTTASNAVALKIDYTLENSKNTGYYYMSYDSGAGKFGKYSTDGQVAFAREDSTGKAVYFMIYNGSYIKNETTGNYLLNSGVQLEELAVEISDDTVKITSANSEDLIAADTDIQSGSVASAKGVTTDISKTLINTGLSDTVNGVFLNGKPVSYTLNNGIMSGLEMNSGVFISSEKVYVSGNFEQAKLIAASYKEDKPVDINIITVEGKCEKTFDELGISPADADKIKIFLWNDINNIVPLCECAIEEY